VDDSPHLNPVLFWAKPWEPLLGKESLLWMHFKVGVPPGWQTYAMQSTDGGLSWSPPVELVKGRPMFEAHGPMQALCLHQTHCRKGSLDGESLCGWI
jgi:hypothetical protein